ncbi:MAG: methyltransferase [Lachnospiraceae bacterium]|nr:methyltransferase [Lachnospiraceae bacterium]
MDNFETIGKVKLDLSNYKGTDVYSDGDIEDEILDIVKNNDPSEYDGIIEKRRSWPVLYHLSDKRENIVEWLDIRRSDKVLEVGAGCGAITGVVSRKAGAVTCVDLSKRRSLINAYRHKECDNITIKVGNFNDIEPDLPDNFDYVLLIGVLEYGKCYIPGDKPFTRFLEIIRRHLKPEGRVVIAIENRLGLKYFAGFKEDHLGSFFSGIENYDENSDVRTFSRPALESVFKEAGFDEFSFFYPYPDYKFPFTIFSDNRLPKTGELNNNDLNLDRDRISLFDEKKAFDSISEDGLFPVFANSYLAVLGPRPDADYVRYCFNRVPEYSIRTVIKTGGKPCVIKYPSSEPAFDHVRKLAESYGKLSERYNGSDITVAPVIEKDEPFPSAEFEFMPGVTLESRFDEFVRNGDKEGFKALFNEYVRRVGYNSDYPYSDTDLVFSNILDDKGKWYLIDYEWAAPVQTDPAYMGLRALYCYMLERNFKCFEGLDFLKEVTGASDSDIDAYLEKERAFQERVTGGRYSLEQIKAIIGNGKLDFKEFAETMLKADLKETPQLYFDRGAGFSEQESIFVHTAYVRNGQISFDADFTGDVVKLRIDPVMESCIVYVDELLINGKEFPFNSKRYLITNGTKLKGEKTGFFFLTEDPNMVLDLSGSRLENTNKLSARFSFAPLLPELAEGLSKNIKRIF